MTAAVVACILVHFTAASFLFLPGMASSYLIPILLHYLPFQGEVFQNTFIYIILIYVNYTPSSFP